MGNVNELAAMIESDRAEVAELSGPIDSSKGQAEGTAGAVAQLGIEGRAAQLRQAVDRIEEAQAIRAALEGVLVKAHWQAMSAVHGTMGPGAKGSGPGGSFVAADGTVTTRDGSPAAGHLDAVPPHLRQDPTPTGEELTGVDPTLSPFQKEHEGAKDDKQMSRFSRFGRKAVRHTEDLVAYSKQLADVRADTFERDYDPWGPTTQTTTEVPTAPPSTPTFSRVDAGDIRAADVVGTSIVVAVIAVEGLSRLLRKKDHGK
jgi:hypothetical protein